MSDEKYTVRITPLKDKIHDTGDVRISEDALVIMQAQIEQLIEILIGESINFTKENGRKTIMEEDVVQAFDNLISPHTSIDEALQVLNETMNALKVIKDKGFGGYLGV